MYQRKGLRLVLFPLPLQGHINPMLELANILYSRGFSITVIQSSFNSISPSNFPHFTFHTIPDNLSEAKISGTLDLVQLLTLLNSTCLKPFKECLSKVLRDGSQEPIACLVTDAWLYLTQAAAKSVNLPTIMLRTGGIASFLAFAAFPLLREKGYLPMQDSHLEEAVTELPPLKVKDLPVFDDTSDPEAFYQGICKMVENAKTGSGLIFNSFRELEHSELDKFHQDSSPVPVFPIGPFHKFHLDSSSTSNTSLLAQDHTCISWLDKQDPYSVVYVSFGSIAVMTQNEFLEVAWGLANSKQPFLWVVRPGLVHGVEWIEPLPSGFIEELGERGYIVKWAPQKHLLAHQAIGAFWTHNGWNSTLESICEGVPMICMPRFTDQKVNAAYVNRIWEVGVQLENGLERVGIARTIRELMEELECEESKIKERVLHLKVKANLCVKEGGSSYQTLNLLVDHILSLGSSMLQEN